MKIGRYCSYKICLISICAFILTTDAFAQSQWTTNGNDIYNSNSGNVGIGIANPGFKLEVEGSVKGGGRIRTEINRYIAGSQDDTVAVGYFSNDGTGKNIRVYLKAHCGNVIDVHTYEINEVAYVGSTTNWLEAPINQNSISYVGRAGYALDLYRQNIASTTDPLYMRLRNKAGVGAGAIQLVIEYDDDSTFTELSSQSTTATAFNASSTPAGGAVDGYYGNLEWIFPVTNGSGWNVSQGGLFVKNSGNIGIGTINPGSATKVQVTGRGLFTAGSYDPGDGSPAGVSISYDGTAGHIEAIQTGIAGKPLEIQHYGNLGIGTSNPQAKLQVEGNVIVNGNIAAKYQDLAEWVPSARGIHAGYVVITDPNLPGHVLPSSEAYDTRVAGVVSEAPGIVLGESGEGKVKVATVGRIRVKVDATKHAIRIGDLLVTGERAGFAMKSEPVDLGGRKLHQPGTLLGKALEPLNSGTGEIMVLLSLQ